MWGGSGTLGPEKIIPRPEGVSNSSSVSSRGTAKLWGVHVCACQRVTRLPTSFSSCPLESPTSASHWANWKPPGPQSRVGEGEGGSTDGEYLVSPVVSLDSHNSPTRMVVAIDISVLLSRKIKPESLTFPRSKSYSEEDLGLYCL